MNWDVIDRLTRLERLGLAPCGGAVMYARVVSGPILPDKMDDVIQLWHDSVVPGAKGQKGFISARHLVDRSNSMVLSMGLWETEADFQASVLSLSREALQPRPVRLVIKVERARVAKTNG
jgi:hypothetical protein